MAPIFIVLIAIAVIIIPLAIACCRTIIAFISKKKNKKFMSDTFETIECKNSALHLSLAVQCQTVSNEDVSIVDWNEFDKLKTILKESFPLIHSQLVCRTIGEHNLVFIWEGVKPNVDPVLFCAHQDVVPAEPEGWEHPPFSGEINDGYVWGRGSFDMKGQLICLLEAVESLLASNFKPQRSVWIALGCDEETRGTSGAYLIAETLYNEQRRFACVIDEGGAVVEGFFPLITHPVAVVGIAEKSYVDVTLTCNGHGGHSSTPSNPTPLGRIGRAVARVEYHRMPSRLTTPVKLMLQNLALHCSFATAFILGNPWLFWPIISLILSKNPTTDALIRDTKATTMAHGSTAPNVISDQATAVVNCRLLPHSSKERLRIWLQRIIADKHVNIAFHGQNPMSVPSSIDTIYYDILKKAIASVFTDAAISPYLMTGGTDALWYEKVSDQVFRFSPALMNSSELSRMHAKNERFSLKNLERGINFYHFLIKSM